MALSSPASSPSLCIPRAKSRPRPEAGTLGTLADRQLLSPTCHTAPALYPLRRCFRIVLLLMMIPGVYSAVIEVTAGGAVKEPTYLFTGFNGPVANLSLSSQSNGTIKASGDLQTGNDNSVDELAARLALAEAKLEEQAVLIDQLISDLGLKLNISTAASTYLTNSSAASTYLTTSLADSTYRTISSADSTYLTPSSADSTYVRQASVDSTPTDGSNNLVTSNGVWDAVKAIPVTYVHDIQFWAKEACWMQQGYTYSGGWANSHNEGWSNEGAGACSRFCYNNNPRHWYYAYSPHQCWCYNTDFWSNEPTRQAGGSRSVIGAACPLPFKDYTIP